MMEHYQSMELYHRAFYSHAFDDLTSNQSFGLEYTQSPDRKINQSAIDGGNIYFSDDEDIEKWGEGAIEIDKSYLDLILNAKEWQVAANYNITVNLTYGSTTFSGSVHGFFDEAEINVVGDNVYAEGAYWGKRSMDNGKVSQIDNLFNVKTSGVYENNTSFTTFFGKPRKPRIFPELKFFSDHYFNLYYGNGGNEELSSSATLNGEDEKAGNFTATSSLTRSNPNFLPASCVVKLSVRRVVITPTKVYAWIDLSGNCYYNLFNIEALLFSGTPLTGIVAGTEGPNAQEYVPLGSSTLKFFGADIPVYFVSNYYSYVNAPNNFSNDFVDYILSTFISCSFEGTSFDITKTESYPT